jgi:hypothetical protein
MRKRKKRGRKVGQVGLRGSLARERKKGEGMLGWKRGGKRDREGKLRGILGL